MLWACSQKQAPQAIQKSESKPANNQNSSADQSYISVSDEVIYNKNNYFRPLYIGDIYVDQKIIVHQKVRSWDDLSLMVYGSEDRADILKDINQRLPQKGDWIYVASFNAPAEPKSAVAITEYKKESPADAIINKEDVKLDENNSILIAEENKINQDPILAQKELRLCDSPSGLAVDGIYPDFPIGCQYTVGKGDTLSQIARWFFGKASKWKDIYEMNRHIIGENPNRIYPKQKLGL